MKKLMSLILFLVLCLSPSVLADGWFFSGGVAGVTDYCTGSTTCSSPNPGSCDLWCEDFEGSTLCYAAHDSVCRATLGNVFTGSGDSIDFTTVHNGVFSCADKGSNAAQITVTGGSHSTGFRVQGVGDRTLTYGEFYYNLVSITLGVGDRQRPLDVTNDSNQEAFNIHIYNNSGTYNLGISGGGMTSDTGSTTINTGTWYRIGWVANQGTDTVTVYLNGAQELQSTDWDTTNAMRRYVYGANIGGYDATAMVSQYDNISQDADGQPAGCN